MDNNVDAKILLRADDITEFLYKAFRDLSRICTAMNTMWPEITVDEEYRAYIIDLRKAIDVIGIFEVKPKKIQIEEE